VLIFLIFTNLFDLRRSLAYFSSTAAKKAGLRVKWADHFGGQIAFSHVMEIDDFEKPTTSVEATVSWSDRKLRDRIHEKELLAKAKYVHKNFFVGSGIANILTTCLVCRKSKLLDDEDIELPPPMPPSISWHVPMRLPERTDAVPPQLDSPEYLTQQSRMLSIAPARFVSDFDVPLSPDPLSDVEQALDMTSQASAVIIPIPFFVPQVAALEPSADSYVEAVSEQDSFSVPEVQPLQDVPASIEFLQSLGLPLFLIGQPVRALQTIAASPSLLSTLVDANGMYDQTRLLNLVQTLSSTGALPLQSTLQYQSSPGNVYGNSYNPSIYGETQSLATQSTRTVSRKSDEGNLHVSGYGPGITESDLIATFSPYVRVDEVVLKGNFAFVNTSDPLNAQRAREALTGTLLNGMPLRINNATRKVRDSSSAVQTTIGSQVAAAVQPVASSLTHPSFGAIHPNIDSVRDDRGNGATKNLFVAGYGPGTNEQMLRELFGQFSVVTGVVSKGNFAFVNTSDRHGAVVAREHLGGTMFNGGILRINFAKETGRLGTSFDLTYGPNTGPNANRARPQDVGYYGRG
jgi:RNA recognition motif-containing protein